MKLKYIIFLFLLSCTNLFIDDEEYNSLGFNGGSWIEFPSIDDMKVEEKYDFSIQFWVSGGEINGNEAPALFSITDNNETKLALYRDPNINSSIILEVNKQTETLDESNDLYIDWSKSNDFNLISILFSDTDSITIFNNDTKIKIEDLNESINIEGCNLFIGAIANQERTVLENFWHGYIDEVRLWNILLDDSTITFHYKNPNKLGEYYRRMYNDNLNTTNSDSLIFNSIIGIWRFNKNNSNSTIEDGSDYGNHGTIYTLPNFNVELSKIGSQ